MPMICWALCCSWKNFAFMLVVGVSFNSCPCGLQSSPSGLHRMCAYYQKLAQSLNEQINNIWLVHVKKTKYDTVVQYGLIFCMFC